MFSAFANDLSITTAAVTILWLVVSPLVLKMVVNWGKSRKMGVVLTHGTLAANIIVTFVACWNATSASFFFVSPYLFGVDMSHFSMDGPMTPRIFLFALAVFCTPWLVLSKVGLISIRDIHQLCKQMRDTPKKPGTPPRGVPGHTTGRFPTQRKP